MTASDITMPDGTHLADIIANLNSFAALPTTSRGGGEIIYYSGDNTIRWNSQTTNPTTNPIWSGLGGGGGDFYADGSVPMTGDLKSDHRFLLDSEGGYYDFGHFYQSVYKNLAPGAAVKFANFIHTTGLGNNTDHRGVGGLRAYVRDDPTVTPATKGVLFAGHFAVDPLIARNNVPNDDVNGVSISNEGSVIATDGLYFSHRDVITQSEWYSCITIDAWAELGISFSGTYTTGIDMSNSTCINALKFPDGTIQNTANESVGSYSYLIFKSGSDYYAMNSVGHIDYGNADAGLVIQYAINNAGVRRRIYITGGTYLCKTMISLTDGIIFEGEGIDDATTNGTILYKDFVGGDLIQVNDVNNTIVRNLHLRGVTGKSGKGIHFLNARNSLFERNKVSYFNNDTYDMGILVDTQTVNEGNHICIQNNMIIYNTYSIVFDSYSDTITVGNLIDGSETASGQYAVVYQGNSNNNTFSKNHVMGGAIGLGKNVSGISVASGIYGSIFTDNYFDDLVIGMCLAGHNNTISNNRFHLSTQNLLTVDGGSWNSIVGNNFTGSGQTSTIYAAVLLDDAFYNTISSNTYTRIYTPQSAVKEIGTSNYNEIIGNVGSTTYPNKYLITGVNSEAVHNM